MSQQDIYEFQKSAPFWQDKEASLRLSAASDQPSTADLPALNDDTALNAGIAKKPDQERDQSNIPENRDHETDHHERRHSTKRQKVFAGSWVEKETDAYIEHRLTEGKKADPNLSRSAVIRMMLEERALDATVTAQHAVLAPMIRETLRAEFRVLTNRLLGPVSRIAYQVGMIMPFLIGCFGQFLKEATLHRIEKESETDARTFVTRRSPQVDEVLRKLQEETFGKN